MSALAASRAGLYTLKLVGAAGQQAVDLAIEPTTTLTSAGRGTLVLEMTNGGAHGRLVVAGRTITVVGTRER